MTKLFFYIALVSFFAFSCGTAKEVNKEENSQSRKENFQHTGLFHEGVRLKLKGQKDEAVEKFEACLQIKQNDDAVYFALSELEYDRKNYSLSAEYVKKAYEIDPANSRYIQDVAYQYYEKKEYKNASLFFKKLVDIDPHKVEWVYGYAQTLVQNEDYKEAIKVLNQMESLIGKNSQLSIEKYHLYRKLKKTDLALNELDEGREVFPDDAQLIGTMVDYYLENNQEDEAIEMLENLVRVSPENHSAQLALADFYFSKNKDDVAFKHLSLAFQSNEMKLDDKMKILIDMIGETEEVNENAFDLAKEMVVLYPNEAKSHSIYADFLLEKNEKEQALIEYKKALTFDDAQFPIWNQVLMMEYQNGDFTSLYKDSKECLSLFPSISSVYLLNGVSANRLRNYEDAVDVLSSGKELIVNDPRLKAEFYGQLGDSYFGLKEYNLAKESYQKAMKLDPGSGLLVNNYAFQLAKAKIEFPKAKAMMEEILSSSPNSSVFIDTYGFILFQKGEYEEAKKQFEDAMLIAPVDIVILEHLGDVYFQLGDKNKALEWWEKAKENGAVNPLLIKKIEEKKYYEE